ncbi:hypothetical protein N789_14250 [Arenimonas oryziterrae DSM 21050 = YC6267]|uniref:B30.2/SPRY domain-containing protein n=2 Tax=Arenimonas TaxID=490567 RepID=A0A091AT56_9GAMM|nr:hypothetical protein N789_14250 [Arenimonas oryziterrae DSM 21050 = YC6267]
MAGTYTNDDKTVQFPSNVTRYTRSNNSILSDVGGLYYAEMVIEVTQGTMIAGLAQWSGPANSDSESLTSFAKQVVWRASTDIVSSAGSGGTVSTQSLVLPAMVANDVIRVLYDSNTRLASFAINGGAFVTATVPFPPGMAIGFRFGFGANAISPRCELRTRGGFAFPLPSGAVPFGGIATLSGNATLANGDPVNKLLVFAENLVSFVETVFPDGAGAYSTDLPAGTYFVAAFGPAGYKPDIHGPIVVD